ncbi:MAG TPA: OmpA family protein [Gemmatimonadaceae bacterium]
MIKTPRVVPMVLALAAVVVTGACNKKPVAPPPQPAATPARDTQAERIAREAQMAKESADREAAAKAARQRFIDDSIAGVRAAEEAAARESDALRSTVTAVIGFEFNKADLRDDAKAALDAKIPILLANANVAVRVSGHADERGSTEYNLALGTQRAAMAKRYLVERGVAAARIETTSFGEERPLCKESTEACWAQNRRDEFEITAGGPVLMKPKS